MQPFSLLSSQQNNSVPSLRAQENYGGITGSRVGPNPFLASEIKVEVFLEKIKGQSEVKRT